MTQQQTSEVIEKVKRSEKLSDDEVQILKQMVLRAQRVIERNLRAITKAVVIPAIYQFGIEQRRRAGHKNAIVLFHKREVKRVRRRALDKQLEENRKRYLGSDNYRSQKAWDRRMSRQYEAANGSKKKIRGKRRMYRNMSL